MESVNNVLRFHHISKLVFECLDDKSLIKSALVCRAWRHFLHSEKFFWIRVINGHRSGWVKFIKDFVHTKKVNPETFCALGKSFLNYHLESKLMPNPFVENGLHPMFAAIYLGKILYENCIGCTIF